MTSIDELFKSSGLPNKRKLDTVKDPNEIYKSVKLGGSSNGRHAQVEDEDEDMTEAGPAPPPEGEDDDGEYGPAAPPDDDDEGDDEEGRFFGGGITRQEAETLDVILAWLAAEDSGAGRKIGELLADKGETMALIKSSLKEQAEGVDTSTDDGKEMLDMLNTLADCID
ncbi:hypothetical protein MAPG_02765 [Magnaporthiopsis poae ATCC 64411]|uniref:Beta-catenin-like protein 1 N-terminal domain-containing protein n=1 Tax=Magnaporthiopsis poae (strain ATCC 64411 / 73-15) TaxID=644358 RepID=A0A0C4DS88_MAGP6|nr:hypothetical protein MAPG_02765 [Magnaporthiopsis poae ATCC 64411]